MKDLKFICTRVLRESAVLADGRITTCCLDPEGKNTFANIYEDDFEESLKKLRLFREKLAEDPGRFPLCVRCFTTNKKQGGAVYKNFLEENPNRQEVDAYVNEQIVSHRLVVEATTACNLTCIGCPTGLRNSREKRVQSDEENRFLDIDKIKTWLSPHIKKIRGIRLFNYGEPLLHPGAIDFSSFLTRGNPGIDLVIATNLLPVKKKEKIKKLVAAQPNELIVSLHGANRESLVKYMGPRSDFNRALKIMKQIIEERNRLGLGFPVVIWKYILFNWNDSDKELDEAKTLAKEHNIDYLGFELTGGELASKRFIRGSEDFRELKKSGFYIGKIYNEIAEMKIKRRIEPES